MKKQIVLMIGLWAFVSIACCASGNGDCAAPLSTEPPAAEVEEDLNQTEAQDASPEVLEPVAVNFPLEAIWIVAPGPLSEVTSPILIQGFAGPTFEQTLVVEIMDENGIAVAIQPTTIQADLGMEGPFDLSLAFSVPVDQLGRILVYDISPRDGGIIHLASVPVYLNAGGEPVIEGAGSPDEIIAIFLPAASTAFNGGTVEFSGYSEYFFESNLSVMLCGEGGSGMPHKICGTDDNVLAEGYAMIESPDIGLPGPFSGSISYSVSTQTHARLVIFAVSPRDGGIEHLSSVELILNP